MKKHYSSTPLWVGPIPSEIIVFPFKKVAQLQPQESLLRIDFGIHGYAYAVKCLAEGDAIKTKAGWAPVYWFHLTTPGSVIGLRDLSTAHYQEWSEEWRQAGLSRIEEVFTTQKGQH